MIQNTKNWYIFRHGLATHSTQGYGDRILTAEVLPEGIPPIRRLGRYMQSVPFDDGVRSELIRCQQTAAIVTEATGRQFRADPRLNEQYRESFEVVRDRVHSFVEETLATPAQHIWVCTHGVIIAALKSFLTHGDFRRGDETDYTLPGQLLIIRGEDPDVIKFDEFV